MKKSLSLVCWIKCSGEAMQLIKKAFVSWQDKEYGLLPVNHIINVNSQCSLTGMAYPSYTALPCRRRKHA